MENDTKGAYNRAPIFTDENYNYWKDCMHVQINSVDRKIWKVIEEGLMAITMLNNAGAIVPKPEAQWGEKDEKTMLMIGKLKICSYQLLELMNTFVSRIVLPLRQCRILYKLLMRVQTMSN